MARVVQYKEGSSFESGGGGFAPFGNGTRTSKCAEVRPFRWGMHVEDLKLKTFEVYHGLFQK